MIPQWHWCAYFVNSTIMVSTILIGRRQPWFPCICGESSDKTQGLPLVHFYVGPRKIGRVVRALHLNWYLLLIHWQNEHGGYLLIGSSGILFCGCDGWCGDAVVYDSSELVGYGKWYGLPILRHNQNQAIPYFNMLSFSYIILQLAKIKLSYFNIHRLSDSLPPNQFHV